MKRLPFILLFLVALDTARPPITLNAAPVFPQQGQGRLSNQVAEQRRQDALKALKINPDDPAANYQLGLIALGQGKPAEALPFFEKVHLLRAADIPPLTGILECQLLLHRRQVVLQTVQTLKGLLRPQDPSLFEVASLLAFHQEYAEAIPILERIRKVRPDSFDVNYNLALAYFQSKQYARSAQVLEPLLKRQPRAEAYNLLAMAEEEGGRYLAAVRSFQKAAEMEPGDEGFRFDYAYELLKHRTDQAAIAIFVSGVRDFPNSGRMRLGLGTAYYLAARPEEAAKELLEAIRIEPGMAFAFFLLGKLYDSAESSQASIEQALRVYLESGPKDAWAFYHYANILQQLARLEPTPNFQPARANLHRALQLKPDFAEAQLQLGIMEQQEGRYVESIPILEKALQFDPSLGLAHFRLGQAYKRLGQTEKAQAEYDLFEQLKPQAESDKDRRTVIQFLVEPRK